MVRMTIAYDGTAYQGFQRQAHQPTVQQTLEAALMSATGISARIIGASRTDSGVHARGQVVVWRAERCPIPLEKLSMVINRRLPADIRIVAVSEVPPTFDPRRDAKAKTYTYTLGFSPLADPLGDQRAWLIPDPVDLTVLRQAATLFLGRHDFRAFRGEGSSARTTMRTILAAWWQIESPRWIFWVTGDGFLYHMVRMMMGGMVKAAVMGSVEPLVEALTHPEGKKIGVLAPAHGLCLERVEF